MGEAARGDQRPVPRQGLGPGVCGQDTGARGTLILSPHAQPCRSPHFWGARVPLLSFRLLCVLHLLLTFRVLFLIALPFYLQRTMH